jgi:hypothetical protein
VKIFIFIRARTPGSAPQLAAEFFHPDLDKLDRVYYRHFQDRFMKKVGNLPTFRTPDHCN